MTSLSPRTPSPAALLELPAVVDLVTAARFHGISRPHAYRLEASGGLPFPVHRVGSRIHVRTAELAASLGLDPALLLTGLVRSDDSAA